MRLEAKNSVTLEEQKTAAIESIINQLGENLPTKSEFCTFELPDDAYSYGISGIHGKKHTARALLFGILLTRYLQQQHPEIDIDEQSISHSLTWHDTQRSEDLLDPDHGKRAADMFAQSNTHVSPEKSNKIMTNIRLHDVPTKDIPQSEISIELHIVKEADKIDRVRLNSNTVNSDCVLDPKRLYFQEVSAEFILLAQTLYHSTKDKEESFASVATAAIELGIMHDK